MPCGDMQQTYEYKVNFLQVKCTKNMAINFQKSPAFMCYYLYIILLCSKTSQIEKYYKAPTSKKYRTGTHRSKISKRELQPGFCYRKFATI